MSRFIFGIGVGCCLCFIGCDAVSDVQNYAELYREAMRQNAELRARLAEVQTDFNRERRALRRIYEED